MRGDPINQAQPVNWSHPLAYRLEAFYTAAPWLSPGPSWTNLVWQNEATFTNGTSTAWNGAVCPSHPHQRTLNNSGTQYLTTAGFPAINSGQFSIAGWIRPTTLDGQFRCVTSRYSPGRQWWIGFNGDPAYATLNGLIVSVENSYAGWAYSASAFTVNLWHHFVATWTGSACELYVNGIGGWSTTPGTPTYVVSTGNPQIGASSGSFFYLGDIGDLLFYDRALSSAEATGLYAESLAGYPTLLNRMRSSLILTIPAASAIYSRRTLTPRAGSRGVA